MLKFFVDRLFCWKITMGASFSSSAAPPLTIYRDARSIPPSRPGSNQGFTCFTGFRGTGYNGGFCEKCSEHKDALIVRGPNYELLVQHLHNNDFAAVQESLAQFPQLPCFLLDEAKTFEMIAYLKQAGACCVNEDRSELAKILIDADLPVNHYYPCETIDDAIKCGHEAWLKTLVFEQNAKSSMTAPHWDDWIVQGYMIKMLYPVFVSTCTVALADMPVVIVELMCSFFAQSLDVVRAKLLRS